MGMFPSTNFYAEGHKFLVRTVLTLSQSITNKISYCQLYIFFATVCTNIVIASSSSEDHALYHIAEVPAILINR